ncbi:MAG: transposase [Myxococcota bacterium]
MPRGPRLDAPGAMHHVIARGIEKGLIFRDDRDRLDLLRRLSRVFPECGLSCFGWAFMPNHAHFVVRTGGTPLAVAMARVSTGYARHFNERHERVGHLFQNRYKAVPILDESHLLTCIRYVHLNPVRAGLVADTEALATYPWTGHAVLIGYASAPFQVTREVLARFGSSAASRSAIEAWMQDDAGALGADGLCLQRLAELVGRAFSVSPNEISGGRRTRRVATARRALAFLGNRLLGMRPPSLCPVLGVSRQAAHDAIGRGEEVVERTPSLSRLLKT